MDNNSKTSWSSMNGVQTDMTVKGMQKKKERKKIRIIRRRNRTKQRLEFNR